jgi:hypothetical protein
MRRRVMNLIHAVVNVSTDRYTGPAVVIHLNGDDTVIVLEELSGHEFRVHKDDLDLVPVTEQPVEWIVSQLLNAWQPFLTRIARHLAERLRGYATFGEPEAADAIFEQYVTEPARAFRALCRREI